MRTRRGAQGLKRAQFSQIGKEIPLPRIRFGAGESPGRNRLVHAGKKEIGADAWARVVSRRKEGEGGKWGARAGLALDGPQWRGGGAGKKTLG